MEDVETTLLNRAIAFILTPIVTALSGLGVVWVEDLLNTDLNDAQVAQIAVAVAVLVGAQLINFLRNLHQWQSDKR